MERVVAEAPIKPAQGLSLSRWSRLKREQRAVSSPPLGEKGSGARVLDVPSTSFGPSTLPQPSLTGGTVNLELPPLSSISLAEDFTPFMQAKVPQILKQQALKALFKDPHFNAMDGLDIYIDDYTVFEPISAEDMGKLSAWQSIQNPLKQVVTPGGYAVDVESEEGRAVLAEQARVEALAIETNSENIALENRERLPDLDANGQAPETLARERERALDRAGDGVLNGPATQTNVSNPPHPHPNPLPLAGEGDNVAATMAPPPLVTPLPHPRYGKRVSDFKFIDVTPETDSAVSSNIHKKTAEKPQ
jgi:hypothetical protein